MIRKILKVIKNQSLEKAQQELLDGVVSTHIPTITRALHHGADVNHFYKFTNYFDTPTNNFRLDFRTVLQVASARSTPQIVDFLIKQGADPNLHAEDATVGSPLTLCEDVNSMRLLLMAGANPNHVQYDINVYFNHYRHKERIDLLNEFGGDINAPTLLGLPLLHFVVTLPDHDIFLVQQLLEAGAKVVATDSKGKTVSVLDEAIRELEYLTGRDSDTLSLHLDPSINRKIDVVRVLEKMTEEENLKNNPKVFRFPVSNKS